MASVGAGSDNTVTLAQAQVRSPSDPGYVPTAPPALTKEDALALLAESGYQVQPVDTPPPPTPGTPAPDTNRGRITKDGQPLTLVLGVAANDPTSVAVANTAADQLRSVGITASVLPLDPPVLYGDAIEPESVRRDRRLASGGRGPRHRAGVPLRLPGTGRHDRPDDHRIGHPDGHDVVVAEAHVVVRHPPTTVTSPTPAPESGELVQAPSNLTGICDRSIQPKIDNALDGTEEIGEVLDAVEPRLWNMSTVLPILQDTTIVATGPSVQNVGLSGAVPVGIVGDAGNWVKAPQ